MLRGERIISSIETQDGYCCVGEFSAWAGIAVVVHTRFITKQQRGEAFVKLPDSTRLEREGSNEMRRGKTIREIRQDVKDVKVKERVIPSAHNQHPPLSPESSYACEKQFF